VGWGVVEEREGAASGPAAPPGRLGLCRGVGRGGAAGEGFFRPPGASGCNSRVSRTEQILS